MQRLRELFAQFTLARLLVAVLLAQLTAVVCLLIYLAATGQSLVLDVVPHATRALPAPGRPQDLFLCPPAWVQPGSQVGDLVRQGDVLGFVGETGNVVAGGPHLHFSVHTASDPNRWGHGVELNPCELLRCGAVPETPAPESTAVP
jgi:hypothetical protein